VERTFYHNGLLKVTKQTQVGDKLFSLFIYLRHSTSL